MKTGLASRIVNIRTAAQALRSGGAVPRDVALCLASCLESLLSDQPEDLARALGIRPRQGGFYDMPFKLLQQRRRDELIKRLYESAQQAQKIKPADHVAAIIRGDAVAPVDAAQTFEELKQFKNLPRSGRQIVRIVNCESGRHFRIDPDSMT